MLIESFLAILVMINGGYAYSACDEVDVTLLVDTRIIKEADNYALIYDLIDEIVYHGSSEKSAFSVWLYGDYVPVSFDEAGLITLENTVNETSRIELYDYMNEALHDQFQAIHDAATQFASVSLADIWVHIKDQPKPERDHARRNDTDIKGLGEHDGDQQYLILNHNADDSFVTADGELSFVCDLLQYESDHSDSFVHFLVWSSNDIIYDFADEFDEFTEPELVCPGFIPDIGMDSIINLAEFVTDGAMEDILLDIIQSITCPSSIDASDEFGEGASMELGNHNQFIDRNTIVDCFLEDNDINEFTPDLTTGSYILVKDYKNDDNTFQIKDTLLITENELKLLVNEKPKCCDLPVMKIDRIEDDNANNNDNTYIQRKLFVSVPLTGMDYIDKSSIEGIVEAQDPATQCKETPLIVDEDHKADEIELVLKEIAVKKCNQTTQAEIREMVNIFGLSNEVEEADYASIEEFLHAVNDTSILESIATADIDADNIDSTAVIQTRRRLFWGSIWRAFKRVIKRVVQTIVRVICPICKGSINRRQSLLGGPKKHTIEKVHSETKTGLTTKVKYGASLGFDVGLYAKFRWNINWGGYVDFQFSIYGHVDAKAWFTIDIKVGYEKTFQLLNISPTFSPRIAGIAVVIRPFFTLQASVKTLPQKINSGIECRYMRKWEVGYYMKTDKDFKNFKHGKIDRNLGDEKGCTKKFEIGEDSKMESSTCNPLELGFDIDVQPIVGVALWEIAAAWLKMGLNVPFRIGLPDTKTCPLSGNKENCGKELQAGFKINKMDLSLYFGYNLRWPNSIKGYIDLFKGLLTGKIGNKIQVNSDNEQKLGSWNILPEQKLGCVKLDQLMPSALIEDVANKCCPAN